MWISKKEYEKLLALSQAGCEREALHEANRKWLELVEEGKRLDAELGITRHMPLDEWAREMKEKYPDNRFSWTD